MWQIGWFEVKCLNKVEFDYVLGWRTNDFECLCGTTWLLLTWYVDVGWIVYSSGVECYRHIDGSNYINFVMSDLATKFHCVWWISISPSDLTIIIESSIADRAIQFIGFTAGRGHIRTVPVRSGQGGQVCLGQASANMYDLSRRSYELVACYTSSRQEPHL